MITYSLWKFVHPIQFVILFTFFFAIVSLRFKIKNHQFFITIISLSLFTEIITNILLIKNIDISLLYSVMFIVHNALWLFFISNKFFKNKLTIIIPAFYIIICIINLFFVEGIKVLNYYSFIVGALIYCIIFLKLSYSKIKNEDFEYLKSTSYLFLLAPVFFFLGFSFLLAFRNNSLLAYKPFLNFELYDIVTNFSNYIYYGILILYIIKEKRAVNEI